MCNDFRKMMEQNIFLALLVTYVSTQDTSTSQGSQSPYLPDQSSWSSVTGLFGENTNEQMSMPRYLRDGGQSSWNSMSNSFSNNDNLGSISIRNLDGNSLQRDQDLTIQPSGLFESSYTADHYRRELSLPDRSRFREQNLMTGNLWTDRKTLPTSRSELDMSSRSNNQESAGRSESFSFRPNSVEPYNIGSAVSDHSSSMGSSLTNQDNVNGNSIINSHRASPLRGNSLLGDLNSIGQSASGVYDSPYGVDSYNRRSYVSDVSEFLDSSLSGQDTMNGNLWNNRNDILSMRGYTLPNGERLLNRNADLSGILTSRSVLDGSFIGQELSGFPGSNQWDASYREQDINSYPFQSTDQHSMPDRGNTVSASMSILHRQGLPWRNARDLQRRLSQFALVRGMEGRPSRERDAWTINRLNTQRDVSEWPSNDIGHSDGYNSASDTLMSGSRQDSFRPRVFLKMVPRIKIQRFEPLPSFNEQSPLSSGLGRGSDLNRISTSQPSSNIDRSSFRSTPDRTTSSDFRSKQMKTYPLQSNSQTSSRRQRLERGRPSF